MRGRLLYFITICLIFISATRRFYFTQIINWPAIERRFLLTKKCLLHSLLYTFSAWVRFSWHIFWKKGFFCLQPPNKCHFQPFLMSFFSQNSRHCSLLKELILSFCFVACDSNEFKSDIGNEPCKHCGANSNSLRTSCRCFADHQRELNLVWDSSSPCYSKFILQ